MGVIHQVLREALCERFDHETRIRIPLLYSDSVTLQNAVELLCQPGINGSFIGRVTWDAQDHCGIIQRATQEFILQAQ